MAVLVDILLGTDGLRDWAQLPDGTKYLLGTTSIPKLVAELAPTGTARRALDAFVAGTEARIRVDVDRFFALLAPARTRFGSSTNPLIPQVKGKTISPLQRVGPDWTSKPVEGSIMDYDQATKAAIQQWAARLEQRIALLNQHAKEAAPGSISANLMKDEVKKLGDMIAWVERPSSYGPQSQNSSYYGLPGGTPGGEKMAAEQAETEEQQKKQAAAAEQEQADEQAKEAAEKDASKMSFDAFKANTTLVESTLRVLDTTNGKIDRLVAAGKKFNHVKAKADLSKIASRVSDICASVDLAKPWLKADLTALSKGASEIAALFPADV